MDGEYQVRTECKSIRGWRIPKSEQNVSQWEDGKYQSQNRILVSDTKENAKVRTECMPVIQRRIPKFEQNVGQWYEGEYQRQNRM